MRVDRAASRAVTRSSNTAGPRRTGAHRPLAAGPTPVLGCLAPPVGVASALAGYEFEPGRSGRRAIPVLRDEQHEYVFDAVE